MNNQPDPGYQYKAEVDTSDVNEVKYWTARWNISSQQLVGAIKATKTNSVIVIEEYLLNRKLRPRRPRYISQM